MPVKSVQDLLLNELRDLYDAEKQLVKALPKVAKAASSEQLRQAIGEHRRKPRPRSNAWRTLSRALVRLLAANVARRCRASSRRPVR